ncbi:MAG: glycosyltransferase [Actinomycetota bacterium]
MTMVEEVLQEPISVDRFQSLLPDGRYRGFITRLEAARRVLEGRSLWNINSTAAGGGVAEMLPAFLADARGAGFDARWLVIGGNEEFFRVTKLLHNQLHDAPDAGELTDGDRGVYEQTLAEQEDEVLAKVSPGDIVILNDPQPLGLATLLSKKGVTCIWRCHIGSDTPTAVAEQAHQFLMPYLEHVAASVFSREALVWKGLDRVRVIPPFIDPFSPKNRPLDSVEVLRILRAARLRAGPSDPGPVPFARSDGSQGCVTRQATFADGGDPPPATARLVTQVSRWDGLKDPIGVIHGFARHIAPGTDAHLVLAGPSAESVADDPEGAQVLADCVAAWRELPGDLQPRVHLACLPMDDIEENAVMVNALQRSSSVVVQKSLAEGFGLTVAEALWKGRPVVASRVGGIQDQVVQGVCGVLVEPADLEAFGQAVRQLLADDDACSVLGRGGHDWVLDHFLGLVHLVRWVELAVEVAQ